MFRPGGTWIALRKLRSIQATPVMAQTMIMAKFNELVRLLEDTGFRIVKEKGSIRYYGKDGYDKLIRVDYHGSKEVPTGTCHAILKAAGIKN